MKGGASVVVATLGRPERLPGLVEAVLEDPGTLELVVVVDGPDPGSLAVLDGLARDRPRLRPVSIAHTGHLGALEEGVRRAVGAVVVLLDDDVVPAPGTITGHTEHHRSTAGLVVAGPMPVAVSPGRPPGPGTRLYAAEYDAHVAGLLRGDRQLLDALWAGNLSMRRADCLRVGLRSVDFTCFYHSDRDLGYRLAAGGLVGRFDPRLGAVHLHERTDAAFLRDARRQGFGRRELHRVHVGRLGGFSPGQLIADLPVPVRMAVRLAGSTAAAERIAAALMAVGRRAGSASRPDLQLLAARLARRVMQWRGAVAGDGAWPDVGVRRGVRPR